MSTVSVKVEAEFSDRVGEWLLAKGYQLATTIGIATDRCSPDAIGILKSEYVVPAKRGLFGGSPALRPRLGTIWLRNRTRAATEQHWVFETSETYETEARELADELASSFDVDIELVIRQSSIYDLENDGDYSY